MTSRERPRRSAMSTTCASMVRHRDADLQREIGERDRRGDGKAAFGDNIEEHIPVDIAAADGDGAIDQPVAMRMGVEPAMRDGQGDAVGGRGHENVDAAEFGGNRPLPDRQIVFLALLRAVIGELVQVDVAEIALEEIHRAQRRQSASADIAG